MRPRARVRLFAAALFATLIWGPTAALAQSPTVALRTNGPIMKPGDCLRLEALALDELAGPLSAQVTYRYDKPVVVRDKDGAESAGTQAVQVQRPGGPPLDVLNRLQLHLLDDTFCFGQGGTPGRYDVEVALRSGGDGEPAATLRTCVVFDDPDAPPAPEAAGCGFLVSGVKRAEADATLVLDANLPVSGFYRGAVLRGATVEAVLDAGIHQTGPHELTVLLPALERRPAGTLFDLVVVEQFGASSTTLSRLPVPPR